VATGTESANEGGAALPRAGPMPAPDVVAACEETRSRLDEAGDELVPCDASPDLRELLAFLGLSEVVPCVPESGLEPVGEAEEREPARGVQEEGDPGDPVA
jgi:hypothetical protein